LTVSNAGNAVTQLTLGGISISGDFERVGGDCSESTVLNGGQNCDIEVAFEPQSVGALNGTLDIDGAASSISVGLTGIGLQGAGLAVSPTKYVFGPTTLGGSAATSFTVTNTGDPASALALTGLFTTGNPIFGITGGSCSAGSTVLAGQETCTVDVLFGPTALGFAAGALAVESDAGDSFVPLVGEGTAPAQIALDPTAFDFGTVRVGEPESMTFTVSNAGGVASSLQLAEVAVTGDRFDVTGGSCTIGTVLAGAETCTVIVEFAPLVTGDYSGELSVASTGGSVQAALSAAGLNEVDLSLQISAQSTRAVAGADAVYEMVVENLETVGDATGVTIESTLTDGVTLIDSSGCVEATAIPICTIGDLAAGQSATVTLNVAVPSSAQGEINLDAAVTADQSDPNPNNNGSGSSSLVIVQSDLSVALTPFIEFVPAALTEVEFELVYGNIGPSDVIGAAIGTNFDAMLTDIQWTCQAGPGAACPGSGAGSGDLDGTVDLAAGSTLTFTVIAALSDPDIDADGIHLSVIIEPDGVVDPNPANNQAQAEIRTGLFADSFEAVPSR
jgi:hypothetical protein